jgi:ribosomal protein S12 methylthiotransferase accessory factor
MKFPGLAAFASGNDVKVVREGAHRAASLRETLARARAVAPKIGLTRMGFLTGLDRVGVPVAMAVRPNARSAAISLGKGLTPDHAAASAMMESIECWHAETIAQPLRHATLGAIPGRALDISRLPPLTDSVWTPDARIPWIEGVDLMTGEPLWSPYECVHAAYTHPMPEGSGCFFASTNGLASGNTPTEALVHALTEVIERDATTLWIFADDAEREARRVDLATVTDPGCAAVIEKFRAAGLITAIWDTTSDVGVASFFVWIMESAEGAGGVARSAIGQGCHLHPEIALSRALTEAAQHRLTVISGARDDLGDAEYAAPDPELQAMRRALLVEGRAPRPFQRAPRFESDDLRDDAAHIAARLQAVGVDEVFAVDLSKPEIGVSVVRVVVPGLEGPHDHERYAAGPRAQAAAAAADAAPDAAA